MTLLLTVLSALEVVVFAGALIAFLGRIVRALEAIGGTPTSSLAKIRLGVRAIEQETGHLAPGVTELNRRLLAVADRLGVVDGHLAAARRALAGDGEVRP